MFDEEILLIFQDQQEEKNIVFFRKFPYNDTYINALMCSDESTRALIQPLTFL